MHLEEHVAVVTIAGVLDALKGIVLLLDVALLDGRIGELDVAVEATRLQLHDLGLGLPHDVRVPLAVGEVRDAILDDKVLRRNKRGLRDPADGIVVNLLEGTASKR